MHVVILAVVVLPEVAKMTIGKYTIYTHQPFNSSYSPFNSSFSLVSFFFNFIMKLILTDVAKPHHLLNFSTL